MLRELSIRNFAIIEEARIEFGPGLNVLTGETGAGKSLLIGALELALGERARGEWIRTGAEEAQVEAVFEPGPGREVAAVLEAAGYPSGDDLVIRRTVTRSGKNRIHINDRAATLGFLEVLGEILVDIHGQHEHQSLLSTRRHRELLDLFGGLTPQQEEVASLFRSCRDARLRLRRLEEEHQRLDSERELAEHQFEEISRARLRPGEEEELELDRKRLLHVERLREVCQEGEELLYSGDRSLADTIGHLQKRLEEAGRIDPELAGPAELLETARVNIEEAGRHLQQYGNRLEGDPSSLEQIEERLALLNRLRRKYGGSLEEMLALAEDLKTRIHRLDHYEEEQRSRTEEVGRLEAGLGSAAAKLSEARKKAARRLEKEVEKELKALGMREMGFRSDIRSSAAEPAGGEEEVSLQGRRVDASGMDQVEFLIRPNPGQEFLPLRRIASGGELSRLMLAVRNVLRGSDRSRSLVFDEVDAGVGGAEAEAVGSRLKVLSRDFQVLCVTHLPQIAVFGDTHLKVSKQIQENRTLFRLHLLEKKDREQEIARMLGGVRITDKTLAHAQEMLQHGIRKEST
jgi:DNA repair protein RecN (Recombination protein N)